MVIFIGNTKKYQLSNKTLDFARSWQFRPVSYGLNILKPLLLSTNNDTLSHILNTCEK